MRPFQSLISTLMLAMNFLIINEAHAQSCPTSDPFGDNPGNLCPMHYHGVYDKSFTRQGVGAEAYYGPKIDPITPGTKLIDKRLKGDYFTEVITGGSEGGVTVKTNSGRVFRNK